MCGKFTQHYTWNEVHAFSQPLTRPVADDELVVSTPMRTAQILRLNADGEREVVEMRWGFAGHGDANPSRPKHMHARAETIDRLRTFAQSFARHRGILLVHTFNEGEELPSGKTKQWVVTPQDRKPVAIAVICEEWHNGPQSLWTFVQATVPANALISRITDRMPAILPHETWATWLGESDVSLDDVKGLLQTFEDGGNWTLTEQPTNRRENGQGSLF